MNSIEAVQAMQDYIKNHIYDEDFSIEVLCCKTGYTRRHADRLFKKYFGKTLHEYINSVLLSNGANELLSTDLTVLDVALNSRFESHEGFTRAFERRFNISPQEYRENKPAIPMFVQYPITHYYKMLDRKDYVSMEKLSLCIIMPVEKPERKLVYLPSKRATDYLSYCAEVGCDWEGLLDSIPEKLDTAALVELPTDMIRDGFSKVCGGVEVPSDYNKPLPEGYFVTTLPACTMLYFQSEPFEKDEDFGKAIESVFAALKKYAPEAYGYEFAYNKYPFFNFGANKAAGARLAVPVIKI